MKPERKYRVVGTSFPTNRTCYSKHQLDKCEELLVDSWQRISAQLMRWVICKEQSLSLWLGPKNTLPFIHSIHSNGRKFRPDLVNVSFLQNTLAKESFKKKTLKFSSFHIIIYWTPYFQSNLELDSTGSDGETFCPVFCCPNPATLITMSPSDLTLMFLLLACWLAEGPGQLEESSTDLYPQHRKAEESDSLYKT